MDYEPTAGDPNPLHDPFVPLFQAGEFSGDVHTNLQDEGMLHLGLWGSQHDPGTGHDVQDFFGGIGQGRWEGLPEPERPMTGEPADSVWPGQQLTDQEVVQFAANAVPLPMYDHSAVDRLPVPEHLELTRPGVLDGHADFQQHPGSEVGGFTESAAAATITHQP